MTNTEFFSNFYVIEDPSSKKNFRGGIVNNIGQFGRLLRTEYKIDHLNIAHLEGGSEPSNLFWNQVLDPFCINQRIVDLLKQNNLKGWAIIPASVKNKSGKVVPDNYFVLTVEGRIAPIDYLKTEIILKQMPGGKFPYFKGLYFNPESWDGSDIFMANPDSNEKYTGFVYVTKKFVEIFRKNKVTNIKFVNFNDFEHDTFAVQVGATDEWKKKMDDKIKKACV